jgi:hypothetical protein
MIILYFVINRYDEDLKNYKIRGKRLKNYSKTIRDEL